MDPVTMEQFDSFHADVLMGLCLIVILLAALLAYKVVGRR